MIFPNSIVSQLRKTTGFFALALGLAHASSAPVLEDFGYNQRKLHTQEARGARPMLIIVATFDTAPPLTHPLAYYDDMVFNFFNTNSINGYVLENSNARFFWTRADAGMVALTNLPVTQIRTNFPSDEDWISNVITQTMKRALFDFAPFDADHNGFVQPGELGILIISNDPTITDRGTVPNSGSGANRTTQVIKAGASSVAVQMDYPGGATLWSDNVGFNVAAHEAGHLLGALDLYGSEDVTVGQNLSLYCNRNGPLAGALQYNDIYHIDPWHKMWFSWAEPRIKSIRTGGVISLPATQATDATAPVILYDPLRFATTTNEYFMLEYRTQSSTNGSSFDRNVAGNGLVIWHVALDSVKSPYLITYPTTSGPGAGPIVGQAAWLFCAKCQGLYYGGGSISGPCPQDGTNHLRGSDSFNYYNYMMVPDVGGPSRQSGWRYCSKCTALFYGPNQSTSFCPNTTGGPTHIAVGSVYSLVVNDSAAPGQHGWKWCKKCQSLFYGPNQSDSNCPKDGLQHDGSLSSDYAMVRSLYHESVFTAGAPDFTQGGNLVWGGGSTTPYLKWLDGTATSTRIFVRPFSPGDPFITVEWLTDGDTWVDFAYSGIFEFGTFDFPFNTFAEGQSAVPHGGTLKIKHSSSSEKPSVSKRVRIEAYGGPVTIGR
jgi:M6 family metalloprotease-like protein